MLARLWWKEYRAFAPVWLVLGLAAGLLQWLFLTVNTTDVRSGALTVAALCWAVLYAFASGAAAFSGEREAKTLAFLDAMPVGRWTLWAGKASFALASTFGLALALAGMAALGTERRDPLQEYGYLQLAPGFATILFEAVAWSLLWSSMSKNPLIAGVMGVVSVYGSIFAATRLDPRADWVAPEALALRVMLATLVLAGSGLAMAWSWPARPPRARRAAPATAPPSPIRASSTGRGLAWHSFREGWTTWLLVALMGVAVPAGIASLGYPMDGFQDVVLAILGFLVGGVSVFGLDNAPGSRRFLVHHGVAPGTAWGWKLLAWGLALGGIYGVMAYLYWNDPVPSSLLGGGGAGSAADRFRVLSVGVADAFAVGLVCGMAIPRRITAALVGSMALVALVPLQSMLVAWSMIPAWSLAAVPLIFVAASRAWAGDWLLEREGPRPWLRLAALLLLPFAPVAGAFVAHRAFEIPDVGRQYVDADVLPPTVAPGQDAAEIYRRAFALIRAGEELSNPDGSIARPLQMVIESGWAQAGLVESWKENRAAIDLARQASALPRARFEEPGRRPYDAEFWKPIRDLRWLSHLLALDARERLSRGDLPGAWDDVMALFRMANQLGAGSPTLTRMTLAGQVHHLAVGLAFEWLAAPGLTPEVDKRALADLKALPPLPSLAAAVKVEASIIERLLDLSGDELAESLLPQLSNRKATMLEHLWFARLVAAPWERERARRICRLSISRELSEIAVEPYQRAPTPGGATPDPGESLQRSGLTRSILPYFQSAVAGLDREVIGRRALEQAVAVVAWKFGHDGQYPETLEALVPELLDRLPVDPHAGRPFRYVVAGGDELLPSVLPDIVPVIRNHFARPGQRLLHSNAPGRRASQVGIPGMPGRVDAENLFYAIP